jgi:PKD repeat protein
VEYGPTANANVWEKFIIPLTADNFSVSEEVFAAAMKQISMIRIRTEMSNSQDNGSLDVVKLGDAYESNFTTGTEDWTLMGDGTLSWSASGGVSGGYLSIADWATGDWHWAVVPTAWTGDISTLIGDNLEFYFKTDHPDYSAVVEFHTGEANRIVLTAEKMNLAPGESTEISVTLNPPAESATTVTLSSSATDYITVPASLSIPAGSSSAIFTATATAEISTDGSSVVSASAAGYSTARLTLTVSQFAGTTLSGTITDATTGTPLQNVQVELAGISTTSSEDGYYILEGVPAGALTAEFAASPTTGNSPLLVQFHDYSTENTQTVTANLDGYINYVNRQVRVIEGEANTLDISLSPILTEGTLRFVLSWDDDPVDLDSYIHTPDIEGDDYFVYYYRKGSSDSPPYTILDVDDTDGFGPETITIHRTFSGIYKYFVHKYAGTESITQSNAVVHIYDETGLIHTLHVPVTGEGDYWEVCDIDGDTKNFTLINEIKTQSPFAEDGSMLSAYAKNRRPAESLSSTYSWEWDFGDGESSSEQNPQHIYSGPGYYTVTLTVSNGDSSSTEVKENYIYVEESITSIDTLLWESFEGEVTGWTLYDEDNDGNSWGIYTEEPPFDTVAHSGERGLGVKWNSAGNNDWIVTPQIYIPESGEILFSFWAHSNSADYPEDFNVKLATAGSALNNFDVTLEEVRQAPLAWTKYQYNLNDYRGATINLAVQCVSVDKYYLWSDDFLVTSGSTTAVDELPEILPATFALHQNYPNPFNPGTNIVYDLPANSMVHLEIFNIRGEMVEQLVSEYRPAGQHRVFWNAHNQPTGVYFIKLTAGEFISVRKMMFMK